MINFIVWILAGLVVGGLFSLKSPTKQDRIKMIGLAVIGALAGGMLVRLLGSPRINQFSGPSLIIATMGAVFLIFAAKMLRED